MKIQGLQILMGIWYLSNPCLVFLLLQSVCPPFQKGGNPNLENFKKGGNLNKILGWVKPKGGEIFSKIKGGTQLFKLDLGIEKSKNGDF